MTESFSHVSDTLYIPLMARIYVSRRFPTYFYDARALALAPSVPEAYRTAKIDEYSSMASASRQRVMDQRTEQFLRENPRGTVIYLGAGLETAYDRLGNHQARFYQLDLPDVAALRRQWLGEGENETILAADMFDLTWAQALDTSRPTLFVASGVFQYFDKPTIVSFVRELARTFPHGQLLFDATNSKGLAFANRYVQKSGNREAVMHFAVDDPEALAAKMGVTLEGVDGFFRDARSLGHRLKWRTRLYMSLADRWKRTMVIRLRWGARRA